MDWKQRYFSSEWHRRLCGMAHRLFSRTPVDPEDACQEAITRLFQRLSRLPPEKIADPLVIASFRNLLHDLQREAFGRPRPPRWIQALGEPWLTVWELFCLARLPPAEIEEQLQVARATVDETVARMRAERTCPEPVKQVPLVDQQDADGEGGGVVVADADPAAAPDVTMEQAEMAVLLKLVVGLDEALEGPEQERLLGQLSQGVSARWGRLSEALSLSDDELLVLRLHFGEGMSLNAVAGLLGDGAHNVRRGLRRTLDRIAAVFSTHGLDPAELLD